MGAPSSFHRWYLHVAGNRPVVANRFRTAGRARIGDSSSTNAASPALDPNSGTIVSSDSGNKGGVTFEKQIPNQACGCDRGRWRNAVPLGRTGSSRWIARL